MTPLPCRLCATCAGHVALAEEAFYCRWLGTTFSGESGARRCHGFGYAGLADVVPGEFAEVGDWLPSSEAGKAHLVTRVMRAREVGAGGVIHTAALVTSGVKSHFETNRPQSEGGR